MLIYIGEILCRKGVLSMTMDLFYKVLQIGRAALGDKHCNMALVLYNITLVYQ